MACCTIICGWSWTTRRNSTFCSSPQRKQGSPLLALRAAEEGAQCRSCATKSGQAGRRDAAVDAPKEHAADAVEVAKQCPAARLKLADHVFGSRFLLIALVDQLPVGRRQLRQAVIQGQEPCVENGFMLLALAGQAFDQVAAQQACAALVALPLFEHLEVGEAVRPSEERFVRVVFLELAIEGDASLLKDVARVLRMGQ